MNLLEKTKLVAGQATKTNKCCGEGQFLLAILCALISPVAVLYYEGELTSNFLVNLILYILGVVPGAFHAVYICLGNKIFRRLIWTIVATFLPPIVVGHKEGFDSKTFLFNIIFTLLGWLPGVIHAWCIIWTYSGYRF